MVFPLLTRADYSKDLEPGFNPQRCGGRSHAAGMGVIRGGPPQPLPVGPRRRLGPYLGQNRR